MLLSLLFPVVDDNYRSAFAIRWASRARYSLPLFLQCLVYTSVCYRNFCTISIQILFIRSCKVHLLATYSHGIHSRVAGITLSFMCGRSRTVIYYKTAFCIVHYRHSLHESFDIDCFRELSSTHAIGKKH